MSVRVLSDYIFLDKFGWIWCFEFRLKPIFDTAPDASKCITYFKSGQSDSLKTFFCQRIPGNFGNTANT